MFTKVLIANRGEIAVRVIRACQKLGITSAVVHSDLDRGALHVRMADEAYPLGGATVGESYLDTDKVLRAITASGADALHPGYGLLSENGDFAEAVASRTEARWVGPSAHAIREMGDKVTARKAAVRAGVAPVPGTTHFLEDDAAVVAFGEEHGWPVAVKAAFGGGGRGMRVIADEAGVNDGLASARREATAFFGRDELYLERYFDRPRHIEMQVLADAFGQAVWLGERDCTAQRRHQKLVEEAPAPGLSPEQRAAMGAAALAVVSGCGYENAGTVEFLYENSRFFFLEMNTRLQVEHPVTEMVTGIDLVAEQLAIAAGKPVSITQGDVRISGHAIECRINAENPAGGRFLPSPGTITALDVPTGPDVRWDGGFETGDVVSQYYDNLVGKLVVRGGDRDEAIARAQAALGDLRLEGVATTIPAHRVILAADDFRAARHDTKWVERDVVRQL